MILNEEKANLRTKTSAVKIILEKINRNIGKDKFSSMEYCLWLIKDLENEWMKNKYRERRRFKDFFMVN